MITDQRQAVVQEAMSWLNTPYHHRANIKGAGVDCALILIEVFFNAGVIKEKPKLENYPMDWMLHRSEEKYIHYLEQYASLKNDDPEPGDILVWKFGRCFSHGAIVVDYPTIVHAYRKSGIVTLDRADQSDFNGREVLCYSVWSK